MIETKKLIEIADVIDSLHQTPEYVEEGIPMVRVTDVKPGDLLIDGCQFVTEDVFEKFTANHVPHKGDIVISRVGTYGNFAYVADDIKFCLGQNTSIIAPRINSRYLYYFLQSPFTRRQIESRVVGSTQKTLSLKNIKELEVPCPDEVTQKKIANVLETIDLKIANNNRINRNLEQLARILLKKWMKDQNKEYELVPLTDVANINPKLYSEKDPWPYINYLDTSSITQGVISCIQFINPNIEKLPSRAKRIVQENDIIFSTVRPNQLHYGIIKEPMKNMLVSTGFAVVRSKYESVDSAILYLCLTDKEFIGTMQQLAEESTSTFPSIKPSDLNECRIPYPVSPQLAQTIDDLFTLISKNQHNSNQLSTLRESLIPKLLSGDIDICDLSI